MNSMKMRSYFTVVSAALFAMVALAGCTTTQSDGSRVKLYDSVTSLASDSSFVASGTVEQQKQVGETSSTSGYIASTVRVDRVLSPAGLGDKLGKVSAISPLDSIVVRQIGSLGQKTESGDAVAMLVPGESYLLFLTPTRLSKAGENEFYITGGTAGLDCKTDATKGQTGMFEKVSNEGDTLPDTLSLSELK